MGLDAVAVALGDEDSAVQDDEAVGVTLVEHLSYGSAPRRRGHRRRGRRDRPGALRAASQAGAPPDVCGRQQAPQIAKGPAVERTLLHVGDSDLGARRGRKGPHQLCMLGHSCPRFGGATLARVRAAVHAGASRLA
jgi:hypothetical protein